MHIKTNLHFHTREDPEDFSISYTAKEGIEYAAQHGFGALALTLHNKAGWNSELARFAEARNVLLIPGIEKNIGRVPGEKRHTLILNCDQEAEQVHTYEDLAQYRSAKPDIFVIAAHPYFPGRKCHKQYLRHYIDLFDAIEHSWFYALQWNCNKPALKTAKYFKKPFVATSDTHFFDFLDTDYAVVHAPEQSPAAIFNALRAHAFENVTRPKHLVREMAFPLGRYTSKKGVYSAWWTTKQYIPF